MPHLRVYFGVYNWYNWRLFCIYIKFDIQKVVMAAENVFFASLNDMKSSKTGDKLSNQILYIVCSESRVSNWAFVY